MYARLNGSTWEFEAVDSPGDVGRENHIRVDASGWPHISYYKLDVFADDYDMKYAFKNETGWHVEVVEAPGKVGAWNGLDLDANGTPHVAYCSLTLNPTWCGLKYAKRNPNGTWDVEVVDTQGGAHVAIAVDSLGRPHISYEGAGEVLKYAVWNGSAWEIETVDSDGRTGWYTSIDLDSRGRPHISYRQPDPEGNPLRGHLMYATMPNGGSWRVEPADALGDSLESTIVVDSHDRPRIAYNYWRDQVDTPSGIRGAFMVRYAEPLSTVLGAVGE
ncbi:MAG: hypothetical protein ACT4PT_07390 [Methanobacteriota archaeon]